jgi:DNA-binding MarR family transcriptional regulator
MTPGLEVLAAIRGLRTVLDRFDDAACASLGINRTDLNALNALEERPLTAGQLAARLGVTPGSVTPLVDRLGRAGYVEREQDPADRRVVLVQLTAATYAAFAELYGRCGRAVASVADHHDDRDLAATTAVLDTAVRAVERATASLREGRAERAGGGVEEPPSSSTRVAGPPLTPG